MNHHLTRATILPEIIALIMRHDSLTEQQALDAFYRSAVDAAFVDDDTGLYGQSPLIIFGLFQQERNGTAAQNETAKSRTAVRPIRAGRRFCM